jgi:hypothetical protein
MLFFRYLKVFIDIRLAVAGTHTSAEPPPDRQFARAPARAGKLPKTEWRSRREGDGAVRTRSATASARCAIIGCTRCHRRDGKACLRARLHARITRSRQTACRATTVPLRRTSPRRRAQDARSNRPIQDRRKWGSELGRQIPVDLQADADLNKSRGCPGHSSSSLSPSDRRCVQVRSGRVATQAPQPRGKEHRSRLLSKEILLQTPRGPPGTWQPGVSLGRGKAHSMRSRRPSR